MYGRSAVFCYYIFFYGLIHVPFTKSQSINTRTLISGDTFTPREMLPIVKKLMKKVAEPGIGKGIISSAKSPEELADKLFEVFFSTKNRIVILENFDISGLDALQALALSGEDVKEFEVEVSTEPAKVMYLEGQYVLVNNSTKKCKYKLVTKKVDLNLSANRRGNALAKKLKEKRHLVISKRRGARGDLRRRQMEGVYTERGLNPTRSIERKKMIKNTKRRNLSRRKSQDEAVLNALYNLNMSVPLNETKNSTCRRRYECRSPTDIDTCQLQTFCVNTNGPTTPIDEIGVEHKEDEHSVAIKQFRKMIGINIIDEEVEKILEHRYIHRNPSSINRAEEEDKLDQMSARFNKIVQSIELTTPIPWSQLPKEAISLFTTTPFP